MIDAPGARRPNTETVLASICERLPCRRLASATLGPAMQTLLARVDGDGGDNNRSSTTKLSPFVLLSEEVTSSMLRRMLVDVRGRHGDAGTWALKYMLDCLDDRKLQATFERLRLPTLPPVGPTEPVPRFGKLQLERDK